MGRKKLCKFCCSVLVIPLLALVVGLLGSRIAQRITGIYNSLHYECVCKALQESGPPPAKDSFDGLSAVRTLPRTDAKIEALIAKMTVEEKVGQLQIVVDAARLGIMEVNPVVQEGGKQGIHAMLRRGKVGALFNGAGTVDGREVQRVALEESRLGIPVLFGADIIHGFRTQFPIPLAEAASFEPELAGRTARATAVESTAAGVHWTFAPMVDVARDQRWGRCCESSGEDIYLGIQFAVARVRGFQGSNLSAPDSLLACPKHFAAYGGVMGGMDYNFVEISEAALRDIHLPAFKASFDAGAITTMSSFNDIAGVPASGNRWLMTDLLRGEWGFQGFVVSDFTADKELTAHGYAADDKDAARKAFLAGVDMSMMSYIYGYLAEHVAEGRMPMEALDEGVRRVLSVKKAIGLFDDPYRLMDPAREADRSWMPAHTQLAREAAKRSIVLLKNEGGVLPLKKSGQKIALIGPFGADRSQLWGCWALFGNKSNDVDIASGIRQAISNPYSLQIVQGCDFEMPRENDGYAAAAEAANQADVVVLAIGEPSGFSGESQSRTQIVVPPAQQFLVDTVAKAGKPMVILLKTGRALALQGSVLAAQGIMVVWSLGSQTGPAVADVLFGDYNPSARLPVSFPQDSGQQPLFYNRPSTGRLDPVGESRDFKARWREVSSYALFPFGYGLSYTTFQYSRPILSSEAVCWEVGSVDVTATVRNTGAVAGEEVVQLYVHDRVASRVRPMRELKGFRKVLLQPGASIDVTFTIKKADLSFHGVDAKPVVEPGVFDVWVSPSSGQGEMVSFELFPPGVKPVPKPASK